MREMDRRDRVRNNTGDEVQQDLDRATVDSIRRFAISNPTEIDRRLEALDRESDVERLLEINASTLALVGLGLGGVTRGKSLWLSGIVMAFLLQHGIQGWCPPLPVMRRLGIRTRQEIDLERYALKALRGDFDRIGADPDPEAKVHRAVRAAAS